MKTKYELPRGGIFNRILKLFPLLIISQLCMAAFSDLGSIPDNISIFIALYPDKTLTPGDILPIPKEKLCVPGYSRTVRSVSTSKKKKVFQIYKVLYEPEKYEVDHFIPLTLGGSNEITNLWVQSYSPKPGALEKDVVERALRNRVCAGKIDLKEAQNIIRTDWYGWYREYLKNRRKKNEH